MDSKMRPLYIFDLDGTIALNEHRQHILADKDDPLRWRRFYAACCKDAPNRAVIDTMSRLAIFADIWIWSGRSAEVRLQTLEWLAQHTPSMSWDFDNGRLTMREERDYTPDEALKKQWLDAMSASDRKRLVAVFDDRAKVVQMWRANGVPCFQVAQGDF